MSVTWSMSVLNKNKSIQIYKHHLLSSRTSHVYYQVGCVVCLYSQFRSRDISQCFFLIFRLMYDQYPRHSWILDSTPWIPDSGFQVQNYGSFSVELGFSITHQKFPWFRNPDFLTWGETSIVFTSKDMQNIWKNKEKLNILQRKYRAVLNGLFRVNKSSEVHGDRTGAPNENIVQNHLNIELLNVF